MGSPTIGDLNNGMRGLTSSTETGFRLDPTVALEYNKAITDYIGKMNALIAHAEGLKNWPTPGNEPGAIAIVKNFNSSIPDSMITSLKSYRTYLDETNRALEAAFLRVKKVDEDFPAGWRSAPKTTA